ncbi:S-adenosyl-L-methionine-dependent methyltransferase [Aspergillus aurantiobrunneus]
MASSEPPNLLSLVEDIRQAAVADTSPCRSSQLAVETPTETVLRLIYQQNAALRTLIDLGIFELLVSHGKDGLSASALSAYTNAERGLIVRLMRVVTTLGLCVSSEPEVYRPNSRTAILTQPIGRDGVRCIYDLTMPTLARLLEYFRDHDYTTPKEYASSPMHWVTGQSQFEWLEMGCFWLMLGAIRAMIWFVSVKHPRISGRFVLQDLPAVVAGHGCEGIEAMEYSFLDLQPVNGARTYFFRAIFHDWPDDVCLQILRNAVSAMDLVHSRIIVVDFVLPDTDTPLLQASLDIQMMSMGSGVERSRRQWTELLRAAGLEIRRVWTASPGMESVIEAGLVRDDDR